MALGLADIWVLVACFIATLGVGLWFGRRERDTTDFFLGGRKQHWLVVGLSIIATEVSALTFLIVPGRSYESDWWYLQMYAGSFVARLLIVYLLLPAFYRGSVTTVYEYLGQRFGPGTRTTASLMFFLSRIVGSGFRLLAASLALSVLFDWPLGRVILGVTAVAVLYTTFGGIKAIIWTDALQAVVFVAAAIVAIIFLFNAIPGSWTENIAAVREIGKLRVFRSGWNPNNDRLFWVLFIHATVQGMAALGVDQDLTQRMLTCPDLRRGQRSLIFNAVAGLPVVCAFLLIGSLVYLFYHANPELAVPTGEAAQRDRVFAHFISTAIPTGLGIKGLLVAGIFAAAMSSLDSALGALSSSAVTDFYKPWVKRQRAKAARAPYDVGTSPALGSRELVLARGFTVLFGVLLAGAALAFANSRQLLEDAFGWVGLIFGGMLGVFLLGVTTRSRGRDGVNVAAMLSSVAVLATLKYVQGRSGVVYLAWPWWVVVGTAWTFAVGALFRMRRLPAG